MLALLPLAATFSGLYVVKKKMKDLDYLIATPDRCKDVQLWHVNMLKLYYHSAEPSIGSGAVTIAGGKERESDGVVDTDSVVSGGGEQENSRLSAEEEVSLVLALGVDAALVPFETQPEKPVFGDAVPVGLWEENNHSALRDRLQHLIPERKEMFQRL